MNQDDFTAALTPVVRHGMTLGAGLLAARGVTLPGDASLVSLGAAALATAAAVAWSLIEKNRTVSAVVEDLPISDVEALAGVVGQFKARGASPSLLQSLTTSLGDLIRAESPVVAEAAPKLASYLATAAPPLTSAPAVAPAPPAAPVPPAPTPAPQAAVTTGYVTVAPIPNTPFAAQPAETHGDGA